MTLDERIRALLEHFHYKVPTFAKIAGFQTPQAVYEMIKGRTKTLSDSAFYKITAAFPSINPEWLKTGIGDMLKAGYTRNIDTVETGGMATLGDQSPIYKDIKIEIEEDLAVTEQENIPSDIEECKNIIKKLRRILSKSEQKIAWLEGKVDEQEKIVRLLISK